MAGPLGSMGVAAAMRILGSRPISGSRGAPVADTGRGLSDCCVRARWKPGICRSTGEVYGGASSKPSSYAGG